MSGSYFINRVATRVDSSPSITDTNSDVHRKPTSKLCTKPTTASLGPTAILPAATAAKSILQRCRTPVNDPIALQVDSSAVLKEDCLALRLEKKPLWDKSLGASKDGGRATSAYLDLELRAASVAATSTNHFEKNDIRTSSTAATNTNSASRPVTAAEFHSLLRDGDRKIATGGYLLASKTQRIINNVATNRSSSAKFVTGFAENSYQATDDFPEDTTVADGPDRAWAEAMKEANATRQMNTLKKEEEEKIGTNARSFLANIGYKTLASATPSGTRPPSATPMDKSNKICSLNRSNVNQTSTIASISNISRQCFEASPLDLKPRPLLTQPMKEGKMYGEQSKRLLSASLKPKHVPIPINKWAREGVRAVRGTNSDSVEVIAAAPSFVSASMMVVRPEGQTADEEGNGFYQYSGDVVNGQRQGQGLFVVKDVAVIRGTFEQGELCGKGVKQWPDGSVYEGYFQKGEPHGLGGTYVGITSGESYEGSWKFGLRDGYGILKKHPLPSSQTTGKANDIIPKHFTYKGNFVNGKMDDTNGHMVDHGHQCEIKGGFKNGFAHGSVVITSHTTGDVYDGEADHGAACCSRGTLITDQTQSNFSIVDKVWELSHDANRDPHRLTSATLQKLKNCPHEEPLLVRYTGPFAEGVRSVVSNAVIPLAVSILPPVFLDEVSVLGPSGVAALLSITSSTGAAMAPAMSISRVGSDLRSPSALSFSIEQPTVMVTSPYTNPLLRSVSPGANPLTPAYNFLFSAVNSDGARTHSYGPTLSVPSYCVQPSMRSVARSSVAGPQSTVGITSQNGDEDEGGRTPVKAIPIDRYCLRFHAPSIQAEHIAKEVAQPLLKERQTLLRKNPFIDVFLPVVVGTTITIKIGLGSYPTELPPKPQIVETPNQTQVNRKKSVAVGLASGPRSSRTAVVTVEDTAETEAASRKTFDESAYYSNVMGLLNPFHNYNSGEGVGTSVSGNSTSKVRRLSARKSISLVASMIGNASAVASGSPVLRYKNPPTGLQGPSCSFSHPLVRSINGLSQQKPFRYSSPDRSSVRPSWSVFDSSPSSPMGLANLQVAHDAIAIERSLVQQHSQETGRQLSIYLLGVPLGMDPYAVNPENCSSCTLLPENSVDLEAFQAATVAFYQRLYTAASATRQVTADVSRKGKVGGLNLEEVTQSLGRKKIFGSSRALQQLRGLDLASQQPIDEGSMQLPQSKKISSLYKLRALNNGQSGNEGGSLPCLHEIEGGVSGTIPSATSLRCTILPLANGKSTVSSTNDHKQRLSTTSNSSSLIAHQRPLSEATPTQLSDGIFTRSVSSLGLIPVQRGATMAMQAADPPADPPDIARLRSITPAKKGRIIPPACGPKEKAAASVTIRIPPTQSIGSELHVLYICANDPVVKVNVASKQEKGGHSFVAVKAHSSPDAVKREGELAFKVASTWKGFVAGKRTKPESDTPLASNGMLKVGFEGYSGSLGRRRSNSVSPSQLWQSPFSGGKSLVVTQDTAAAGEDPDLQKPLQTKSNSIRPLIIPLHIRHLQPAQLELLTEEVNKRKPSDNLSEHGDVSDVESAADEDIDMQIHDIAEHPTGNGATDTAESSNCSPRLPHALEGPPISIVVIGVDD